MTMLASQITSLTVVYSIVYSGVDQSKHQSSASLAFVQEIHRGPVNFPHKWPVTRKMLPFDDVIMIPYNSITITRQWFLVDVYRCSSKCIIFLSKISAVKPVVTNLKYRCLSCLSSFSRWFGWNFLFMSYSYLTYVMNCFLEQSLWYFTNTALISETIHRHLARGKKNLEFLTTLPKYHHIISTKNLQMNIYAITLISQEMLHIFTNFHNSCSIEMLQTCRPLQGMPSNL